jgi:hypothetical protein
MRKDSKKADSYLAGNNQSLQTIMLKVAQIKQLQQRFLKYIEPNLKAYCQVANCSGTKLVVVVANGSVATQLRFASPDVLRRFKQDAVFKYITQLEIKVRPQGQDRVRSATKPTRTLGLSTESAAIVAEVADTITDPKLRAALLKIASYTHKK